MIPSEPACHQLGQEHSPVDTPLTNSLLRLIQARIERGPQGNAVSNNWPTFRSNRCISCLPFRVGGQFPDFNPHLFSPGSVPAVDMQTTLQHLIQPDTMFLSASNRNPKKLVFIIAFTHTLLLVKACHKETMQHMFQEEKRQSAVVRSNSHILSTVYHAMYGGDKSRGPF